MELYQTLWFIFVTVISAIFFFYLNWRASLIKDIPSFQITFPFGILGYNNILKFILPVRTFVFMMVEGMSHLFAEEGMVYIKLGLKNVVILCSPETAEVILSDRNELKKSTVYDTARLILGKGLITSDGDADWKFHRKLISSNFNARMLNKYQEVMAEKAIILCQKLSSIEHNKPFAISEFMELANFDITLETINGTNLNVQKNPNSPVIMSSRSFLSIWVERIFNVWQQIEAFSPFPFTNMGKELQKSMLYVDTYYRETLAEKKKVVVDRIERMKSGEIYDDCSERPCMVEYLLNHQLTNEGSLTDQNILDEAITVISAGYETTSVALAGALFLIGHHPAIQNKIHDELDQIFGLETDRLVNSDDISKMTYLNLVIMETLRLYPAVPMIARVLQSDFEIKGKIIPKGTEIAIAIGAIHKNPKYHPKPDEFIPERFLPENKKNMHRYAHIPFSSGPRDCVGSLYAMKSMLTILSTVLRKFWIESVEQRDKVVFSMGISLQTTKPVHIKIMERSKMKKKY